MDNATDTGLYDNHGVMVPVDSGILSNVVINKIKAGKYERREARVMTSLIQEGERVLEVGAGIGFVSALIATQTKAAAVLAIEANPELKPVIENLYRINGVTNVEARIGVLSNNPTEHETDFYIRKHFWGSSLDPDRRDYVRTVKTPYLDADDVIAEFKPSLIVADIEGGELDLFTGSLLLGVERLFIELHPDAIGHDGIARLFSSLAAKGFAYDCGPSSEALVMFRRF